MGFVGVVVCLDLRVWGCASFWLLVGWFPACGLGVFSVGLLWRFWVLGFTDCFRFVSLRVVGGLGL